MKNKYAIAAAAFLGIMASDVNVSYADAAFWKEKDQEEAVTQEKLHNQKLEIMDAKADAKLRLEKEKTEQERLRLDRADVRLMERELRNDRLRPQNNYIIVEP
jgi:hypothetical protein